MHWDFDGLFEKAKLYFERAFTEDRESSLFPFWASLGLEFLARATLAHIHPSLLADPKDEQNILYAFGYGDAKNPKSISITTVLKRCSVIVPEFTKEDIKFCLLLIERRNAELHSAINSFNDFHLRSWLSEFYRLLELLLKANGSTLDDLLGADEAKAASKTIVVLKSKKEREVKKIIANFKEKFEKLDPKTRLEKMTKSEKLVDFTYRYSKCGKEKCPSCGASGLIQGELIRNLEPTVGKKSIIERAVMLPVSFRCNCCNLNLKGHEFVQAAGLGTQYTREYEADPVEYYEININDYFEPDCDDWRDYY